MADRTLALQRQHDTREELGPPVDKSDAGNYHHERLKGTPVIPLTSLSDQHDAIKGLACGADGFVVADLPAHRGSPWRNDLHRERAGQGNDCANRPSGGQGGRVK